MGFRVNADQIKTKYTETLAGFISELRYEDLPAEVTERAKMIAMQVIGVSLACRELPIAQKAISLGKACGGCADEATLWADGSKTTVPGAVFANSTLADAMDWEDCSWTGHPSAGIIPSAWAVGEALHKSGKEVITSIVAGYEVYQRIAMAVQPPDGWPNYKGWGLTSWQIFAALVPAAKLYGLDKEQINQALGFGATGCPIPGQLHHMTMSDAYHFEHGFRSLEGVMSVLTAKAGVDNYTDCFDDPWSFENHLTSDPKPEWYNKDLGDRWLIMETLLKHWPANMWIQTPLEITYDLITENNIHAEDIKEIIVDPPTYLRMYFSPEGYSSVMQAQFSIPYMLAVMILDPVPSVKWNDKKNLKDKRVLELASKVRSGTSEMLLMPKCFKEFQQGRFPKITIRIETNDNRVFSKTMDYHLGHPRNMMNRDQFIERFKIQASPCLKSEIAEEAAYAISNLEKCEDICSLSKYLGIKNI